MAPRAVEVLAPGPPSSDPYDPAATAWALAGGLRERGAEVRVLHPAGPAPTAAPDGLVSVPIELALRRPGAALEAASFAAAAGRKVRRDAELVLRDPIGLGRLGLARGSPRGPVVAGFARSLELARWDTERTGRASVGLVGRLDAWRDRRAVRRLEAAALGEADRLFFDAPDLSEALRREYEVPERRLRAAPPPVEWAPDPPTREAARESLRVPLDVPVVAAPASAEASAPMGTDRALEAFRRVRPFFPGLRLVIAGSTAPIVPGVVSAPARDRASFSAAFAAADVALFLGPARGFDPGIVLALHAGCVPILGPAVSLPLDPGPLARRLPSDDPGEAASALAELIADPAMRREVAAGAEAYADRFRPSRVAELVESESGRVGG
jgi:glycosyltransferase involved in cell wall biosynthesis